MVHASFRCLVDAPYRKIWQSLSSLMLSEGRERHLSIASLDLVEVVTLDPDRGVVTLTLEAGQRLKGERRFEVREDKSTSRFAIESILDWQAADPDVDRCLHSMLDRLVRDQALAMKRAAES